MKRLLFSVTLALSCVIAEEYTINLKDPVFTNGVLSTEQGGVISGSDFRIQAQKIEYVNRVENGMAIKKITAEGDLLLEKKGRIFVGKKLEYNLAEKTGKMIDGKTTTDYWFIGGDEIELLADGSFWISNAYLTTVEGGEPWWELSSGQIDVSDQSVMTAKNIKIKFFEVPVFWFPKFKLNLNWGKKVKESTIRYKFIWDQILKQKISMRYELYSSETFDLFGRFDYRFKRGPGAAIETDYHPLSGRTFFQTKNYAAYDKVVDDEHGNERYRFQGLLNHKSLDERTKVHMSYDKLSDNKMPQDFKSDDFELGTQKRTILWVKNQQDNYLTRFSVQPRINYFQSINQELPLITLDLRPFPLGESGIIFDNWFSAGYLNYVYATNIAKELSSSKAARLETNNTIYRNFDLDPISFTPYTGFIGIFYSNTQEHHPAGQAIGSYGFDLNSLLYKNYPRFGHTLKPYLKYQGLSSPPTPNHAHFIFNINDGYFQENLLRPGLVQNFYPLATSLLPDVSLDLYSNIFLGPNKFHRTLPKLYTTWEFIYPSWHVSTDIVYNIQEWVFDRTNIKSDWTVSENFAFGLEFRHRSKFDWRKSDHDNYLLDLARPIEELVHSPISDGRDTVLSRFQIRLSPLWTCHIESHHGWGRKNEPRYDGFEVRISTLLTGKWQLQFGYKHTPGIKNEWVFPYIKLLPTEF